MEPYGRTVQLITTDSPNHRIPTVGVSQIQFFSSDGSNIFGVTYTERATSANNGESFWWVFVGKVPIIIDVSGMSKDLLVWTSASSKTPLTYWVS